jgi:hypothetical protein
MTAKRRPSSSCVLAARGVLIAALKRIRPAIFSCATAARALLTKVGYHLDRQAVFLHAGDLIADVFKSAR